MSEEEDIDNEPSQEALDFIRARYGVVEQQDIGPGFFVCWTEKAHPNTITKGDKFFYFFVGKLFLTVEAPCGFADEIEIEDILHRDLWGKGRRGSAYVLKNTIPHVVLEEFPLYAQATIDLMVQHARELEASYSGQEVPENLFPLREVERQDSGARWIQDDLAGAIHDGFSNGLSV